MGSRSSEMCGQKDGKYCNSNLAHIGVERSPTESVRLKKNINSHRVYLYWWGKSPFLVRAARVECHWCQGWKWGITDKVKKVSRETISNYYKILKKQIIGCD